MRGGHRLSRDSLGERKTVSNGASMMGWNRGAQRWTEEGKEKKREKINLGNAREIQ